MKQITLSGALETLRAVGLPLDEQSTIEEYLKDPVMLALYAGMVNRGMSEKHSLKAIIGLAEQMGKLIEKAELKDKSAQVADLTEPLFESVRAQIASVMAQLKELGFVGFEAQFCLAESSPVSTKTNLGTGPDASVPTVMGSELEIIIKPMKRRVLYKVGRGTKDGSETDNKVVRSGYMGAVYVATQNKRVKYYTSPKTALKHLFKATHDGMELREKQGEKVDWYEKLQKLHGVGMLTDLRVPDEALINALKEPAKEATA